MFYNGQKELEMQYKMNKIIGQCRQKCEALHEKFTEKLEQVHTAYQKMAKRQKRKLDEMYDKLRSEYESAKRSSVQPANFFSRAEPDLFSSMANMMDGRASAGQGQREEIWPSTRQKNSSSSAFDLSGGSPAKTAPGPVDTGTRRQTGSLFGAGVRNPTATLRNLIISPMKRPQLSRNHPHIFT
ncbi:hypothetical protein B296_00019582 [Ensete ventricosum]|uniref:E3 ubiquitin-protein ligase CCNB1IP1 n=1 Tax=Ensete ventricosum TaxID=4639 RepID=A0A427B0E0_ENSVE|nr:hypothetical protein B296_00019582 [Ensete ventricosum]